VASGLLPETGDRLPPSDAPLVTEVPFTLPRGYVDADGGLHRDGVMRAATAFDEIAPLKDPRVQANPGYLVIILLARVITRLGTLSDLTPRTVEGFFAADLAYLQEVYNRLNDPAGGRLLVACPHCNGEFEVDAGSPGE
jgi:hypothetical protein